jgi:hypothetical protein
LDIESTYYSVVTLLGNNATCLSRLWFEDLHIPPHCGSKFQHSTANWPIRGGRGFVYLVALRWRDPKGSQPTRSVRSRNRYLIAGCIWPMHRIWGHAAKLRSLCFYFTLVQFPAISNLPGAKRKPFIIARSQSNELTQKLLTLVQHGDSSNPCLYSFHSLPPPKLSSKNSCLTTIPTVVVSAIILISVFLAREQHYWCERLARPVYRFWSGGAFPHGLTMGPEDPSLCTFLMLTPLN